MLPRATYAQPPPRMLYLVYQSKAECQLISISVITTLAMVQQGKTFLVGRITEDRLSEPNQVLMGCEEGPFKTDHRYD